MLTSLPCTQKWSLPSLLCAGAYDMTHSYSKMPPWAPGCLIHVSWVPPGSPGCLLGVFWVSWMSPGSLLGVSWVSPGVSWVSPGCLLNVSWCLLAVSWCLLGFSPLLLSLLSPLYCLSSDVPTSDAPVIEGRQILFGVSYWSHFQVAAERHTLV